MKRWIITTAFAAFSTSAVAQYYEPIRYYGDNPFIFCTFGVPQDCWAPISKELGLFTVTNYYCFNAYSALLFARVCPQAFGMGAALGTSGASGVAPSAATSRDSANAN